MLEVCCVTLKFIYRRLLYAILYTPCGYREIFNQETCVYSKPNLRENMLYDEIIDRRKISDMNRK